MEGQVASRGVCKRRACGAVYRMCGKIKEWYGKMEGRARKGEGVWGVVGKGKGKEGRGRQNACHAPGHK